MCVCVGSYGHAASVQKLTTHQQPRGTMSTLTIVYSFVQISKKHTHFCLIGTKDVKGCQKEKLLCAGSLPGLLP